MADDALVEIPRLTERVRAAAREAPEKDIEFRRLVTRSKREFDGKSGWMIPLTRMQTDEVYGVEVVRCDPDDPGAVAIRRDHDESQIRIDAQTMYELWVEDLSPEQLA